MSIKIHCSSLGLIMTEPKGKGETLSVGAKSHIEQLAKEHVYGYRRQVSTREIDKGKAVEDQSIELLNEVLFTDYAKNTVRLVNNWLTGECDIVTPDFIYDIKSSYSLDSFPATVADAGSKLYEYQLRAYMMLYERSRSALAYCMVDTPDDLIGFGDELAHKVSHINPLLRVTFFPVERDAAEEKKIITKCEAAQVYFEIAVQNILKDHNAKN